MILLERGTLFLSRKMVVDEPGMRRQESDCFWRGERLERGEILEPVPFHGVHKSRSARTNITCSVYLSMFWPSSRFSSLNYRPPVEMCKCFQFQLPYCHILNIRAGYIYPELMMHFMDVKFSKKAKLVYSLSYNRNNFLLQKVCLK